ncbi:hypothetical protein Rrhod_3744 [Rhodococcus rhodnii LMG 5362]|uniref:Uncharacterized protein n=1 Tax=Rhodococcus rhodnii LMG 5362 TaxID=1273125 RepID=R7WI57_9NOCA|nr:hypothetical protein Rrhod_3744 [Rhodococcus rhodnii LMG 5362]
MDGYPGRRAVKLAVASNRPASRGGPGRRGDVCTVDRGGALRRHETGE